MKYLNFYKEKNVRESDTFNYFISTMRDSIATWDYYVNWNKVKTEAAKLADELNILNGLIGTKNLKQELIEKINKYPSIILTFPVLLAVRGNLFQITERKDSKLQTSEYHFKEEQETDAEHYWEFFEKSGLAELFENRRIKNIPDYVFGIEVGLDSNGRKNRGGHAMEDAVEFLLKDWCVNKGYSYLKEANAAKIKNEWGYEVPVDKSSRRYDFVINTGNKLLIFETNFYQGDGSKLKSTAGEYRNLFDVLDGKFEFIWITDGAGWKSSLKPLEETFAHNNYVFSLSMLEDGVMEFLG